MAQVVEAAGGVLYRWRNDFRGWMKFSDNGGIPTGAMPHSALEELEVCVVHRPRYDDWTWPKGKLDPNETHCHAAVREIGEETGLPVELGTYLGDVEYPLADEGHNTKRSKLKGVSTKHVRYWTARPITSEQALLRHLAFGPIHLADRNEIDNVVWLPIPRARHVLSHPLDREILDSFVDRVEEGDTAAHTILLVRHAKAEARKTWTGSDAERPITPRGAAAAFSLNRELACFNPTRLVSSPWVRCRETLQAYSWQTGLPLHSVEPLTEDAYAANPESSWDSFLSEITRALTTGNNTAICMHRPVIGGIFTHLRKLCITKALGKRLIGSTPYMPTGTAIVLRVVTGAGGPKIIDIQKVTPLVY